jgi:hypothetical protein
MLYKLVFSVVANLAHKTFVRLLTCVSSLVIISISDCSKFLRTVLAAIRLFPSVDPHVNNKIASLIESLSTLITTELGLHIF